MSNSKQSSKYTIVYVYGPTRCKQSYMDDEVLNRDNGEFVKIGKTDFVGNLEDCTEEKMKNQAITRCNQTTRTGISDWCDIYDTFIFPQVKGKNVDDSIRNLLCNDVYSLDNSKSESNKGDIEPGKEFVYGVSRNHIKHAVESYCFQLIIGADVADLDKIQTICEINSIAMESEDEEECEEHSGTRKKRDINMILTPGDRVYLVDSRDKSSPVMDFNGKQVEAVFVGNKKFSYNNGKPKFASPLAIELINKFKHTSHATISGNDCWEVEQEINNKKVRKSLSKLYDETMKQQ